VHGVSLSLPAWCQFSSCFFSVSVSKKADIADIVAECKRSFLSRDNQLLLQNRGRSARGEGEGADAEA